jgi:nucleoside-diphosphate-sugar epimerase
VFNVACGKSATLLDVIDEVSRLLGTRVRPKFAPPRRGDVRHSKADVSKAKRLLGYRASVSLREGLERTVAWLRERV